MTAGNSIEKLVSLMACASSLACGSALQSPAAGGRTWYEARSQHFLVQTDAGAEEAAELSSHYEGIVSFFENVAFRSKRQPKGLTRLVVFSNEDDYVALAPQLTGGFFRRSGGAPYDPQPTIVVKGQSGSEEIIRLFQHELTHRFVAFHFPQAPIWVHEGLAVYYETLLVENGKATVGLIPRQRVHPGPPGKRTESQAWFARTSSGMRSLAWLPPGEQVRSMSQGTFYGDGLKTAEEVTTAAAMNYVSAWALVHPLMIGPDELQTRFLKYLNALAAGKADAWQANFDQTSERLLEEEYRGIVSRPVTRSGELPVPAAPVRLEPIRTMRPAEVHWLWAALRDPRYASQRERSWRDVEEAIRLEPESPDGYLLRSAFFERDQKLVEQRRDVELALTKKPDDANALGLKAKILLEEQLQRPAAERNFAELDVVSKRLSTRANTSQQWMTLARYDALNGRLDKALLSATRAAQDSSCWGCFWLIGDLELARSKVERSARFLRVATTLAGEDAPPSLRQRLGEVLQRDECRNAPSGC